MLFLSAFLVGIILLYSGLTLSKNKEKNFEPSKLDKLFWSRNLLAEVFGDVLNSAPKQTLLGISILVWGILLVFFLISNNLLF